MGWKLLTERFGIEHQVQINEKGLCIGSGYVSDMIVIDLHTGSIEVSQTFGSRVRESYAALLAADPAEIVELIRAPDVFATSVPVYTFEDGTVIEKMCETPGYPNVTHDGRMMFDNRYSIDKNKVIAWAKRDCEIWVDTAERELERAKKNHEEALLHRDAAVSARSKINADYPTTPTISQSA